MARKPKGYYRDFRNLKRELRQFMVEYRIAGRMPTPTELRRSRRSDLEYGIRCHHGGFQKVAQRLALSTGFKPKGYWQDFENVKREILGIAPQEGAARMMPLEDELRGAGHMSLANAIHEYHGGFQTVAKRLKLTTRRRPNTSYNAFTDLKRDLFRYIEESGTPGAMPTRRELEAAGEYDLANRILKQQGFPAIGKRLGLRFSYSIRRSGYWKEFTNVAKEVRDWVSAYGESGVMPTSQQLGTTGMSSLTAAITKHGGFAKVAERLGLRPTMKPRAYWSQEVIEREIRQFVRQNRTDGCMPTDRQLRQLGRFDLANAIAKSRLGLRGFAERLGLKSKAPKPRAYWDAGTIDREVLEFVQEHGLPGTMPTQRQLVEEHRSDLVNAIIKSGGWRVVAKRLTLRTAERPKRYWDDFDNVEREILAFNEARGLDGVMPSRTHLALAGENPLANAIEKKYGGYPAVAKRLGLAAPSISLWPLSTEQIVLAHEMLAFFDVDIDDHTVQTESGTDEADIVIRKLRLVIEYDSVAWHLGSEAADRRKTQRLVEAGWHVIRAREATPQESLAPLGPNDVVVPRGRYKEHANRVLRKIEEVCGVRIDRLTEYLDRRTRMNAKLAKGYIDKKYREKMGLRAV